MAWAKVDDQLHGHPKIKAAWRLSRPAIGLHMLAMSYCAAYGTEGFVPVDFVEEKLPNDEERASALSALTAVPAIARSPLWEAVDGGWRIHDWAEYNGDSKTREKVREAKSRAGRAGAAARWGDSRAMAGARQPANGRAIAPSPSPFPVGEADASLGEAATSPPNESTVARRLFDYWRQQCRPSSTPPPKFTADRRQKVLARLREGYTETDIRHAIDGAAVGAFVDEKGKRFDDLELICRSGSKLESFVGRAATSRAERRSLADALARRDELRAEQAQRAEGDAA